MERPGEIRAVFFVRRSWRGSIHARRGSTASGGGCGPLVRTADGFIHAWRGSTAPGGGCGPLVRTADGFIHAWRGSTASGGGCGPLVRTADGFIHAWHGSTAPHPRIAWIYAWHGCSRFASRSTPCVDGTHFTAGKKEGIGPAYRISGAWSSFTGALDFLSSIGTESMRLASRSSPS